MEFEHGVVVGKIEEVAEFSHSLAGSETSAVSARDSTHNPQASREAVRVLIPPTPRPCFIGPSVTASHYSTTVFQALRQTLRSRAVSELRRTPSTRSSQNSTSRHLGE